MFFCEFCEIYKNTFFKDHLRTTASGWFMSYRFQRLVSIERSYILQACVHYFLYFTKKAFFWKRIIKNPRKLQINFCFWIQFLFMEIILKNKRDVELFTRPFSGSQIFLKLRSSHRRCSVKKGVLKNSVNFTGKHLCWCLFLITSGLQLY